MSALAATASPLVRRYRLEEFFTLEPPPGGGHYELIAGVLYMVPPPTFPHDLAASRLVLVFAAYAAANPARCMLFVPRAAVWTLADTYLEPDLFLVTMERVRTMEAGRLESADLVARAWALKETAADLWAYRYVGAARRFFRRWYFWATHSRLPSMIAKARMLKTHLPNILTYLKHRITNATAEGLNSKIQWIRYTARGFRNRENFKTAIYFHCGKLDLYPH